MELLYSTSNALNPYSKTFLNYTRKAFFKAAEFAKKLSVLSYNWVIKMSKRINITYNEPYELIDYTKFGLDAKESLRLQRTDHNVRPPYCYVNLCVPISSRRKDIFLNSVSVRLREIYDDGNYDNTRIFYYTKLDNAWTIMTQQHQIRDFSVLRKLMDGLVFDTTGSILDKYNVTLDEVIPDLTRQVELNTIESGGRSILESSIRFYYSLDTYFRRAESL